MDKIHEYKEILNNEFLSNYSWTCGCRFELGTRGSELITRGFEITKIELVTREIEVVDFKIELVDVNLN